jgi:phosphate uptake regulator
VLDPQYAIDVSPETTIKVSRRLEDDILSGYLLGYEVITIEAPKITEEHREKIRHAINRLVGVEIIEEDTHKVVLQCLLKPTAFPPEKILRREYILSAGMFKEAFEAFLENDSQLAKTLPEKDEEIDRLYFLLVRLLRSLILNPRLSEKLNISLIDCLDYRLIASLMENIADRAVELANVLTKVNSYKLSNEALEYGKKVKENIQITYEEIVKAIFSKDEKILADAIQKREETELNIKKFEEILNREKEFNSRLIYEFLSFIRRVMDHLKDMVDLVTTIR